MFFWAHVTALLFIDACQRVGQRVPILRDWIAREQARRAYEAIVEAADNDNAKGDVL